MKRRPLVLGGGALALGALTLPACSAVPLRPAQPMRPLRADDFRRAGRRGVGLGPLRTGIRAERDYEALQTLGVDHVRVFVHVDRDGSTDRFLIDDEQLRVLDAMLASLEQRGIYLVLTASFQADEASALWRSDRLQAAAVDAWRGLAQRLKGRAVVAGFDLVNEPVPPGLSFSIRQARWMDLAVEMIEAVRAVDPGRVLIVEAAPNALPEAFDHVTPLPFDGLVYSVHSYMPMNFTHQTVMTEFPQPRSYPGHAQEAKTAAQELTASLDHLRRFTQRHDVPLYVGEFSAVRWAPDGSAARYVQDAIAQFNRHGWSWAYHEFRTWHGWDPEMPAHGREARPRRGDAPVLQVLRAGLQAVRS